MGEVDRARQTRLTRTLHDIGEHDASSFLVLEYLAGDTLDARVASGLQLDEAQTGKPPK
jgi:hypothetical protein